MDHRDPSPARGVLALPTPLELVFTPPCGSVIGYAADGSPELAANTPVPGFIAEVQERMVLRAPEIADRLIRDADNGRACMAAAAWRMVGSPSPGMCEAFRAIVHDETFGTGMGAWRPAQRFPWTKALAAPFHRPHRTALVHWLIDQKWPQAILDSPARAPMRWMFNRALAKM
jgi:hypothetical protein